MELPDYEGFFREYARVFERSLGGCVNVKAIRGFFAESFVSATTTGQVAAGANDQQFEDALRKGYAFYKAIGAVSMAIDRIEPEMLYENHDRVRVFYVAGYKKRDGSTASIAFDVMYLVQRRPAGPKIFGFITGDEMAALRRHGLVNEAGEPA
ncbi:MAG: hypothetical protein Q8R33_06935 [Burkholderiales bacterium]|nr:hypothetical protein [Burkholderiales bacterium]